MKWFFTLVLLCVNFIGHTQELIKTDWEQGYVKDGKKYSVWQYFNAFQEPELVINHSTGKVMFLIKDTTEYVINKNGEWVIQDWIFIRYLLKAHIIFIRF